MKKGGKKLSYNPLSRENANKIKTILLSTPIDRPVKIDIEEINLSIDIRCVHKTVSSRHHSGMEEVYFMKGESRDLLKFNNNSNHLFYNVGGWSTENRFSNTHITLGSNSSKLKNRFCQLELSQAIEDEKHIYILKNLTKLAGKGAMTRLNKGLGSNKTAKHERRNQLVQELNAEVIFYDGQDWLCIDKIKKEDLKDESKYPIIYYSFINKFLLYAFTIEKIVL